MFEPLTAALRLPRRVGRLRTRPDRVLGDKAYSSRVNRGHLRRRKIKATITRPRDRREHRRRNTVERSVNLLKQNRAVATRHDKRAVVFDGTVLVASIRIWGSATSSVHKTVSRRAAARRRGRSPRR